jgi:hypothetical protein
MALERLRQLEARIHESHDLSPPQKEELLRLVLELNEAMAEGSITHGAEPHDTTSGPGRSAPEGARQDTRQHPVRLAMDELSASVEAFEASHPELVNAVNQVSTLLANMGM